MANMNVTYSEMNDAAGRLNTGKEGIVTQLQDLQKLVGQLVAGGFVTDAASGAFNNSYDHFTRGTLDAVNGLDGMVEFLKKASQALGEVDAQLAKGIGG